jgi:hypothetical protein
MAESDALAVRFVQLFSPLPLARGEDKGGTFGDRSDTSAE